MFDQLRIPPERDLPPAWLERRRAHLVGEVSGPARTGTSGRRRWALAAVIPATLLVLGATGVAAYVATRPATSFEGIGCYERADLNADTTVEAPDGRDPAVICAEVFRETGVPYDTPRELAPCVLPSGVAAVFPRTGPNTCTALGLAELGPGYGRESKRLVGLHDALVAQVAGKCLGEDAARRAVRGELDERGLRSWRIEVGPGIAGEGFSEARPCASLAFEDEDKKVILVPDTRS